jgi:hypothetical protein
MTQERTKPPKEKRFISHFSALERERRRPYSWREIAVVVFLLLAAVIAAYDLLD